MNKYCLSCGGPLWMPELQGPAEDYCKHCTDEKGNLKSYEEMKLGTAEWLKTWQPNINQEKALLRAELYLKSMPAWADS